MRIYTTDKPRDNNGVMSYAKLDLVDVQDIRFKRSALRKPGGAEEQVDAILITSQWFDDGQYLYCEDYDERTTDPQRRHAIFTILERSASEIGRHQYRLQFKEYDAA